MFYIVRLKPSKGQSSRVCAALAHKLAEQTSVTLTHVQSGSHRYPLIFVFNSRSEQALRDIVFDIQQAAETPIQIGKIYDSPSPEVWRGCG